MRYLVLVIVALAAAVGVGHLLQQDPGFIIIGYGGKFFRMSFVPFAVMAVAATLLVYVVLKALFQLLTVGKRWRKWSTNRKLKKSHHALDEGLLALASGDFVKAEKLLSQGAKNDDTPAVHWLAAAEAAQGQQATERRDLYLARARETDPHAEAAIGIKRAHMQLDNDQLEQARAAAEYLSDRYPDNQQILLLRRDVYRRDGDWQALLNLLPAIKRHRALSDQAFLALEEQASLKVLADYYGSLDELNKAWESLSKSARANPVIVAKYAEALVSFGQQENAENLLRKTLSHSWHKDLIRSYRKVQISNSDLQLERAESWLNARPDDPDLLITLASLAITANKWPQARSYLDRLSKSQATPEAYQLLADVLEHEGSLAEASRCRRDGLAMALGAAPINPPNLPVVVAD
ncbi:MAG: heme biosynthesis HemY N-terminal domain-containing protein [Gammaproteobacteria bacterium]